MTDYLDHRFDDWESIAADYDELPLWSAPFGQLLLEHVPLRRGMRVLDSPAGPAFRCSSWRRGWARRRSRWASIRGPPACSARVLPAQERK